MKLSELIAKVGDENIVFQNLEESFVSAQKVKRGVNVTFGTDQVSNADLMAGKFSKTALIIWIPKDKIPTDL